VTDALPPEGEFLPREKAVDGGEEYVVRPVGVVRSPLADPSLAPRQGALAGTEAEIEIFPRFAEGLVGVAERAAASEAPSSPGAAPPPPSAPSIAGTLPAGGRGKIVVLCFLDRARRDDLTVHPGGNPLAPARGVFATRSPHRPNPVSLHTVELLEVRGNVLVVRGMDAVDGTPVLDVKPYAPGLDG
jgi:tRNA (Thr-GGU) A37 N-methylase